MLDKFKEFVKGGRYLWMVMSIVPWGMPFILGGPGLIIQLTGLALLIYAGKLRGLF